MRRVLFVASLFVGILVMTPALGQAGVSASNDTPVTRDWHTGTWIVQLVGGTNVAGFLESKGIATRDVSTYENVFTGFSGEFSSDEMERIAASPLFVTAEENRLVRAEADQTSGPVGAQIPNSGALPWGLDAIDQRGGTLDGHYAYSSDGTGVRVYVLDTGVNAAHADFGSRVVDGWSYRSDNGIRSRAWTPGTNSYLGSCKTNVPETGYVYDSNAHPVDVDTFDSTTDVTDKGKTDNEGHGTHVAGISGGSLTGVAKNVTIVPVRILNSCGSGNLEMAIAGINWILGDHSVSQKAVVNMSIGFTGRPCLFERVIDGVAFPSSATSTCRSAPSNWLFNEGIVVVAAAGNDPNTDPCTTAPAGTPGTISVGAIRSSLAESYYTAYGDCVDVFAPGGSGYVSGGVNSTWHYQSTDPTNSSTYANESGTSMAAPHVTGAVAQYLQGLTLPGDVTTVPTLAWTWLKQNATCDAVSYYNASRTTQTANRLLNIGSAAIAPCAPRNVAVTQAAGQSVVSWDEVATGNGSAISGYQVSTVPSSAGCTTNASTFTCTLTGLVDGTTYAVSVKAVNGVGAGTAGTKALVAGVSGVATTVAPTTTTEAPVTTTTVAPDPVAPTSATTSAGSNSLTISWPAVNVAGTVEYTVAITPGGVSCTTRATSCTFVGVRSGANYSFTITARNVTGSINGSSYAFSATAGFSVKLQSVKVRSRTLLTRIVTSPSRGKRTYRVTSGKCTVSAGRLVAPTRAGTCRFKVSIARSGSYPAMSSTVKLVIVG